MIPASPGVLQAIPIPALDSVPGTALLGLGVAGAVWGLRFAIRRRRDRARRTGTSGARPLAAEEEDDGPAVAAGSGSAPPDVAVVLPSIRPGSGTPVRHTQVYAAEFGAVAGGLLAWLASLASVDPLVAGLVGSAVGAASFWRVRSMALATARQEVSVWLGAVLVGSAIGWLVFL